jgi:hypothetical protein
MHWITWSTKCEFEHGSIRVKVYTHVILGMRRQITKNAFNDNFSTFYTALSTRWPVAQY